MMANRVQFLMIVAKLKTLFTVLGYFLRPMDLRQNVSVILHRIVFWFNGDIQNETLGYIYAIWQELKSTDADF